MSTNYNEVIGNIFESEKKYFMVCNPSCADKLSSVEIEYFKTDSKSYAHYGTAFIKESILKLNMGFIVVLDYLESSNGEWSIPVIMIRDAVREVIKHEFLHFIAWYLYKDDGHGKHFHRLVELYTVAEAGETTRRLKKWNVIDKMMSSKVSCKDVFADNE